jgi:hypothetical protein
VSRKCPGYGRGRLWTVEDRGQHRNREWAITEGYRTEEDRWGQYRNCVFAFSQQIRINQAVEAGAQYASSNPYNGSSWSSAVSSAITNAISGISITPTVGSETCGCPNSTSTAIVTHDTVSTCGPSNGGTYCPDGSSPGYYITISAQATYTSVMPYSILGSSATLSSTAIVRVQ